MALDWRKAKRIVTTLPPAEQLQRDRLERKADRFLAAAEKEARLKKDRRKARWRKRSRKAGKSVSKDPIRIAPAVPIPESSPDDGPPW